jgi:hypothetical protein
MQTDPIGHASHLPGEVSPPKIWPSEMGSELRQTAGMQEFEHTGISGPNIELKRLYYLWLKHQLLCTIINIRIQLKFACHAIDNAQKSADHLQRSVYGSSGGLGNLSLTIFLTHPGVMSLSEECSWPCLLFRDL